jgi:hypothetical protein
MNIKSMKFINSLFFMVSIALFSNSNAQSNLTPAELKQMQTRLFKLDSAKAIKLIGDDCKDSGGQGSTVPIDSSKGKMSAEVICFVPTKTQSTGGSAVGSVTAGDVASVVGDAITSNASSVGSSLPLIGGLFSLIGAASSISQSNDAVEKSKTQMQEMMSAVNQLKYEINPSSTIGESQVRIRMYKVNQEQVIDSVEYQKRFDSISRLLASDQMPAK